MPPQKQHPLLIIYDGGRHDRWHPQHVVIQSSLARQFDVGQVEPEPGSTDDGLLT